MDDIILSVTNLNKSFGGLKILKDVNFEVRRGEKLALIGPNGAGKSTLLNAVGGQGPATSGKILFNGTDITALSPNRRLSLGLGRSFQVNNLFWQLSIRMNVMMALYGKTGGSKNIFKKLEKVPGIGEKAEQLLEVVGLKEKMYSFPGSLSYGEQRLLEMLMAFATSPQMVLLDEPSAGFPTAEVGTFARVLRDLAGDATLLFCAHDMDLVFSLADEIMVLYFGTIIAKGTPDEIAANPKVQEIYIGKKD